MKKKLPDFDIAPVLEGEFGAEDVPRVRGAGWRKMLCPFHPDTFPSASVNQYGFNCHGCRVQGDAIKLLREESGLSYADAVRRAEELTGTSSRDIPPAGGWGGSLLDTSGD